MTLRGVSPELEAQMDVVSEEQRRFIDKLVREFLDGFSRDYRAAIKRRADGELSQGKKP